MAKRKPCDEESSATFTFRPVLESLHESGILKEITASAKALCKKRNAALTALNIRQCDGGVGYGVSFCRASCVTTAYEEEFYPFGSVFEEGLDVLSKVLNDFDYVPLNANKKTMLKFLLEYLVNQDFKNFILKLGKSPIRNETQLAVALSEHLFSQLTKPGYIVDNHGYNEDFIRCNCGCGKLLFDHQGNTSIGHVITWHGYLDIIVGQDNDVAVKVQVDEDSPGGNTSIEVNTEKKIDQLCSLSTRQQIISQAVVFSFLQRKRHPRSCHFLIPCVGVNFIELVFFFYDSENDVLLESKPFPFMKGRHVNYDLVIALWLALNYKFSGSGLSEELKRAPKANFFEKAGEYLDVYRNELTQGDVNNTVPPAKVDPCQFNDAKFVKVSKFTWPNFE